MPRAPLVPKPASRYRQWPMPKRASTDAKAKTNVKAKEAARRAITAARERTPARARADARPPKSRSPALFYKLKLGSVGLPGRPEHLGEGWLLCRTEAI